MSSYQGGHFRPVARKDKVVSGPLLPNSDTEPNVIIRQFTLQKGNFPPEPEKRVPTYMLVNKEKKKKIRSYETQPIRTVSQTPITKNSFDSSQSAAGSVEMQEKPKDLVTESSVGQVRAICPKGPKTVPLILAKKTKLGMVGGKLVILHPMPGPSQVVRDMGQPILVKHANVYKKMKLSSNDNSQSDTDEKCCAPEAGVLASSETTENENAITAKAGLSASPKQAQVEVLANAVKQSPSRPLFKLESSGNSPKGCLILPIANLNCSDNGGIVKLSTGAQNEFKVVTTVGNQVQPLVKKNIEVGPSASAVMTNAELVLPNSAQKKAVVLTAGLQPGQPVLNLAEVPGNSAAAKTLTLAGSSSEEKTNGRIKYVTLPRNMLPKLLPGTKVYTKAAVPQKNVAVTEMAMPSADKPVVAAATVTETTPAATAPVEQHSSPNKPAIQNSPKPIELKVDVDPKGDVINVVQARKPANEKVEKQALNGSAQRSWALLQKRCNQAMELKRKVLQKDKCSFKVRKIQERTVTEVERGTQTSFFSLVEPGRLVEIQLEEGLNGENKRRSSNAENEAMQGDRTSTDSNSVEGGSLGEFSDAAEPPEPKKSKSSRPLTVYDVLVQHNIQAMSEKQAARAEQISRHKAYKGPHTSTAAPLLVQPSSPPIVSTPDFTALLDSPKTPDTSKLNTPEMRRQLLKDFEQCMERDNGGNIPLHTAVHYEKVQLVKRHCSLLAARKASLDVHNDDSETPLHMAVMLHNVRIVQILISFGAKVSVTNGDGNTALHLAILQGNQEVVNAVLNTSIGDLPLNTFNDEGLAPLHLCAQAAKLEEAKALLKKGAEIDLKDAKSGRTPLFHAVERNCVHMVKMFLNLGANPNVPNFSGHTPLLAANEYCDTPPVPVNDMLFMTPKLRPINPEDRSMVAALFGLSADVEPPVFVNTDEVACKAEER